MSNYDRCMSYMRPAIDRVRYGWWTSGHVPPKSPAWADNRPAPPIEEVMRGTIFCMGVPNLWRRVLGLEIPHLGDLNYDGGTVAYFGATGDDPNISKRDGYFKRKGVERQFNLAEAKKRPGTLIGRRYRNWKGGQDSRNGQGHGAIVLANGRLLQSYDVANGNPGLNASATIEDSHAGWFYEVMIYPEDWMGKSKAPGKVSPEVEVTWYPAHESNFSGASRPIASAIDQVVLHVTQGEKATSPFDSAINHFQNPASNVSAHYVIRSKDGHIGQCVSEMNIAWHSGDWPTNTRSIGIEHEAVKGRDWMLTEAMLNASARLVADICKRHGLPMNRTHIKLHREIKSGTECPVPFWNMDSYLQRVKSFMGTPQPLPTPKPISDPHDSLFGPVRFTREEAIAATKAIYPDANMDRCRAAARAIYATTHPNFVRPDFRYVQFLWETRRGLYGGDSVWPNLAGIKKGPKERGGDVGDEPIDFLIPRNVMLGAHIQAVHWCPYTKKPLPPNPDPIHERYWVAGQVRVEKPAITRISELGGGAWATDPEYANHLRSLMNRMAEHAKRIPNSAAEHPLGPITVSPNLPIMTAPITVSPPKESPVEDTNPQEPVNAPEEPRRSPRDFWASMDPAVAGALRLLGELVLAAVMTALSAFLVDYQTPADASPTLLGILAALRIVEGIYDSWRESTGRSVPKPPEETV